MWDITQTRGPAVTAGVMLRPAGSGPPAGLWEALTWLARREGFAAEREFCGGADSMTNWSPPLIRVRPGLSDTAAAWALAHELGHVLMHSTAARAPYATTAQCRGVHKVEADSVAFIVATRFGLDTTGRTWPQVASWAGSDLRARPEAAIRATGDRITAAAASIIAHLDIALFGTPSVQAAIVPVQQAHPGESQPEQAVDPGPRPAAAPEPSPPPAHISRVLHDAELFYLSQVDGSWVPGYLATRWRLEAGFECPLEAFRAFLAVVDVGLWLVVDRQHAVCEGDARRAVEATGVPDDDLRQPCADRVLAEVVHRGGAERVDQWLEVHLREEPGVAVGVIGDG
jgi:hypothetical protein